MSTKQNIVVCTKDYEKLYEILDRMPHGDAVNRLIDELDRAEVIASHEIPTDVVSMYSIVSFTVLQTDKLFTYKLVYPEDYFDEGNLSILTPVSSALLGLRVDQKIEWSFDNNKTTHVRIDAVSFNG